MNVNMEYKHLTDDEFYGEEISKKYYFKFEASTEKMATREHMSR